MKARSFRPDVDAPEWTGGHSPYDIVKEGTIAIVVVALLTVLLAVVFGSPDEPAVTVKTWSNATPLNFAATALRELNATSRTATYGAPYNDSSVGQKLGPITLAHWVGVHIPINTAHDFVIDPLRSLPDRPALSRALNAWSSATASTRSAWLRNYSRAATRTTFVRGNVVVPTTDYGPVGLMINDLTQMARSGALDQALITGSGYYTTDYTKPLLFLSDGSYLSDLAAKQHLLGTQWGMMNETGSYPGQAWLWLYTLWYQVPPFNSSANADILVWATIMLLSALLLFVPFIPGLRAIPRRVRVYRLIWREHYRSNR